MNWTAQCTYTIYMISWQYLLIKYSDKMFIYVRAGFNKSAGFEIAWHFTYFIVAITIVYVHLYAVS